MTGGRTALVPVTAADQPVDVVLHRRRAVLIAVVVLVTTGCAAGHPPSTSHAPSTSETARPSTAQYLPGVAADVYLPAPAAEAPVVVLIPGGGWRTADRRGLAPLAKALAADGMVVVNATYRAAQDGVRFPTPVQDVVCAIDFATLRARQDGITPGPVIVVGHSSGAQLSALAALAGPRFRGACPYPSVLVDGLVGLAGPYDVLSLADIAYPLFGVSLKERPDLWRQGDPATWVGERTGARPLAVLLAHGDADDTVPITFTTSFAAQLRDAGHPVRVVIVPKADHQAIYQPGVIEATIRDWVRTQLPVSGP
jgi:acetyl esterase/lipase